MRKLTNQLIAIKCTTYNTQKFHQGTLLNKSNKRQKSGKFTFRTSMKIEPSPKNSYFLNIII